MASEKWMNGINMLKTLSLLYDGYSILYGHMCKIVHHIMKNANAFVLENNVIFGTWNPVGDR